MYVISIDKERNSIVVGEEQDAFGNELTANNINYIAVSGLKEPTRVSARVRYMHPASPGTVFPLNGDTVKVQFDHPQWAITPGQAVVFYDADTVVGGGTILTAGRDLK